MVTELTDRAFVLPRASKVNVAGLLGFGAMIVVQIAGGVDNYPTIPPGLVVSVAVVGLVIFGARWRWTALVGLVWPILLTVGAFLASGSLAALTGEQGAFVQVTSLVQRAALLVALAGGVGAVIQRYKSPPAH